MTNHPKPSGSARRRSRATRIPAWLVVPLLGALFGIGLWAPIPTSGNHARSEVLGRVQERLPGWEIVRAGSSWEGAWTVVATCGGRQIGFQMVPGHGLPPGVAWLQPQDEFTRSRLARVSDDSSYLIWYERPFRERSLSCRSELARPAPEARVRQPLD